MAKEAAFDNGKAAGFKALQQSLGYSFRNMQLLCDALTHTSFVKGDAHSGQKHYERLEFLGDAVLELCASEYIYAFDPPMDEGDMTRMRAGMVCEPTLAAAAQALELGPLMRLGRGEEGDGGREKPSILADMVEAILGAAYLDGGLEAAKGIFTKILPLLKQTNDAQMQTKDYKTILQELLHKMHKPAVVYSLAQASGPDHAKRFVVHALIGGKVCGEGEGLSKKYAEQQAAKSVLDNNQF